MNFIRSLLCTIWGALWLIPVSISVIIGSFFLKPDIVYYRIVKPYLAIVIGAVRVIGGVEYRQHGRENLPAIDDNQPIVLCAKHQSTWETFALVALMPHPVSYVFKRELLAIPFFGWAISCLQMIHIDRSNRMQAWKKVAEQGKVLMASGHWVIMFPEGTRTERGTKGRYKTGATRLAAMTGASVIPIAVTSARCWPRRSFSLKPGVIDVSIGKPISSVGREADELMKEVENWIESEMQRLDPEAYSDNSAQN